MGDSASTSCGGHEDLGPCAHRVQALLCCSSLSSGSPPKQLNEVRGAVMHSLSHHVKVDVQHL
jgi:hypothetical protein